MRVYANELQCEAVGKRLAALRLPEPTYATFLASLPTTDPVRLVDYFFFLSALLFDFKGMAAKVDGATLQGTDLFFALARRQARRDPDFFSPRRLACLTLPDLQRAFSLTGNPAHTLVTRTDERAAILRDDARRIVAEHDGSVQRLLAVTAGYLRRPDGSGLLDILAAFQGYRDPHHKKAFVLLKALEILGLWRVRDPENLFIPVDYHLIRVALRVGLVEVTDRELAETLRARREATAADDEELRGAVKAAYKRVEILSRMHIFVLDELFWTSGRSCCHHGRPPRCAGCDSSGCSVTKSFAYTCSGTCPLAADCLGSRDQEYRGLHEPNVTTTFY